jgi:hypothetical protein
MRSTSIMPPMVGAFMHILMISRGTPLVRPQMNA